MASARECLRSGLSRSEQWARAGELSGGRTPPPQDDENRPQWVAAHGVPIRIICLIAGSGRSRGCAGLGRNALFLKLVSASIDNRSVIACHERQSASCAYALANRPFVALATQSFVPLISTKCIYFHKHLRIKPLTYSFSSTSPDCPGPTILSLCFHKHLRTHLHIWGSPIFSPLLEVKSLFFN